MLVVVGVVAVSAARLAVFDSAFVAADFVVVVLVGVVVAWL